MQRFGFVVLVALLCASVVFAEEATVEAPGANAKKANKDAFGINNLVNSLINSAKQGHVSTISGKTTIMQNSNSLTHKGGDSSTDPEEMLKKTAEEGNKVAREDQQKERNEDTQKLMEQNAKDQIKEQKARIREEQDKAQLEQDKKASAEQKNKFAEVQQKKVQEQKGKKIVQQAKERAEKEKKAALAEMGKKRAEEQASKKKLEEANKEEIKEIHQKAAASRAKAAQELVDKRKQEETQKEEKKKAFEKEQEQNKKKEEEEKRRRANAAGTPCNDCENVRVYFDRYNLWQECPDGKLMVGMYRSHEHYLRSIQYFHCCSPCRDDRSTRLNVHSCETGNWVSSFDSAGWSTCPGNTYMKGFYKSSCEWIYCLEYAKCCAIDGSRGRIGCDAKGSWGSSFDAPGWSLVDGGRFMAGLYRSGGSHWLYNIEYPYQCTYYAF